MEGEGGDLGSKHSEDERCSEEHEDEKQNIRGTCQSEKL
jgi:hypothetical protein